MKTSRNVALTHERLKQLLHYDPETGVFTWRVHRGRSARVGDIAGSIDTSGYRQIKIGGTAYSASRLAWFYVYKSWPSLLIDHNNRNRVTNNIENLREATYSQNSINRSLRSDNKLKVTGVSQDFKTGNYRVRITIYGKTLNLGHFTTLEKAIEVRREAEVKYFGEFARMVTQDGNVINSDGSSKPYRPEVKP